jgi:hypothetical protein
VLVEKTESKCDAYALKHAIEDLAPGCAGVPLSGALLRKITLLLSLSSTNAPRLRLRRYSRR